jgi:hypothetical protein
MVSERMFSEKSQKLLNLMVPIVVLLFVCGSCFYACFSALFINIRPAAPIAEVTIRGTNYVLTCRSTLDGPVELYLYECETDFNELCTVVGYETTQIDCEREITIQARDGMIEVTTSY